MEDLKNNYFAWIVAMLFVVLLGLVYVDKVLVNKTADAVIEKLRKQYSPNKAPYGPNIAPDVISDEVLHNVFSPKETPLKSTWIREWQQQRQ